MAGDVLKVESMLFRISCSCCDAVLQHQVSTTMKIAEQQRRWYRSHYAWMRTLIQLLYEMWELAHEGYVRVANNDRSSAEVDFGKFLKNCCNLEDGISTLLRVILDKKVCGLGFL